MAWGGLTVYPNLKLQLWRSGIRQNRLAQMLGMDETMLSKIINGYRAASPELRGKIAGFLKSDEEWLFQTSGGEPDVTGPARIQEI
jgi:transcriptional regulator with XRE-family HTH domain